MSKANNRIAFLAAVVWFLVLSALAFSQDRNNIPPGHVGTGLICTSEGIEGAAAAFHISSAAVDAFAASEMGRAQCRLYNPMLLPIRQVMSGPYTDHDGDNFFIVRVIDESRGGASQGRAGFALAWPGLNANLGGEAGKS